MRKFERPYGYLTSGDVAQMSKLKGLQVHYFLEDYGCDIGGRRCIKESAFLALKEAHKLEAYYGYPMWASVVRKGLKKKYKRRIDRYGRLAGTAERV